MFPPFVCFFHQTNLFYFYDLVTPFLVQHTKESFLASGDRLSRRRRTHLFLGHICFLQHDLHLFAFLPTYYHFLLLSGGHFCFVSLLIHSVLLGLVTSVSCNMTSLCLLYTLFYLYQLLTSVLYNTMCTDQLFSNGIVPSICICNMYCATISFA